MARIYLLACAAVLAAAPVLLADTVTLKNGDKISGTIEQVGLTSIVVTTPYAGKLTIERTAVLTLQSDKPVQVVHGETTTTAPAETKFVSPTSDGKSWQETAAYVPPAPVTPPPPPRATKYLYIGPDWKNQLAIGVVNTTGNDNTTSFVGGLDFHYTHKPDELDIKIAGAYGVSNGTQNAAFVAQSAVYRHDITDKWYLYADEDMRYDGIMGISFQGTTTAGAGVYLFRTDKFKLDFRAGPGVTYLKTFDGNESFDAAVRVGQRAEYIFDDRISATTENSYTQALSDFNLWHLDSNTALNVKLDLESGLGLKFAFVDTYENQPSAGRKNNDTRLVLSLTLDF